MEINKLEDVLEQRSLQALNPIQVVKKSIW
jgi:hypothetical protein